MYMLKKKNYKAWMFEMEVVLFCSILTFLVFRTPNISNRDIFRIPFRYSLSIDDVSWKLMIFKTCK